MIDERIRKLEREYEAMIGWVDWTDIFGRRTIYDLKIPKSIELQFEEPKTLEEEKINKFIDEYRLKKTAELKQELFKQKERLGDAE